MAFQVRFHSVILRRSASIITTLFKTHQNSNSHAVALFPKQLPPLHLSTFRYCYSSGASLKDPTPQQTPADDKDFLKVHKRSACSFAEEKPSDWKPPPPGYMKFTVNGSHNLKGMFVGMVCRNSEGILGRSFPRYGKSTYKQSYKEALKYAENKGYKKIIIETDCELVLSRFGKGIKENTEYKNKNIIDEIEKLMKFDDIRFELGNIIAHTLAKKALKLELKELEYLDKG